MRTTLRLPSPAKAVAIAVIAIAIASASCTNTQETIDPRNQLIQDIQRNTDEKTANVIRKMPFMQTKGHGADMPALFAIYQESKNERFPKNTLSQTIYDETTWRIAPIPDFERAYGKHKAHALLSPHTWSLEVRSFKNVQVGVITPTNVNINIPWPTIEAALAFNEFLTGEPLPAENGKAIPIIYGGPVPPNTQATSTQNYIAIRTIYGQSTKTSGWILAHEITHRWWHSNAPYIDEGISELIASLSTAYERPYDTRVQCQRNNLNQTENRAPELCDYKLGGDLFHSLYNIAGQKKFRTKLSKLYEQAGKKTIKLEDIRKMFHERQYKETFSRLETTQ